MSSRPKHPKYARNKNVLVIGGSGSGKTRFFVKPNLMHMLKTVEQMSKVSGIGENKLRELMDSGELEYIQNGNRRLIADAAIWDWYHRAKKTAKPPARQGG